MVFLCFNSNVDKTMEFLVNPSCTFAVVFSAIENIHAVSTVICLLDPTWSPCEP